MIGATDIPSVNESVRLLAGDGDPIDAVVHAARARLLEAIDAGWNPPPYDPFSLARVLRIPLRPVTAGFDARTVADPDSPVGVRIDYDPGRPNGRLRFSVAHEIGHTLFPDVAEETRHRTNQGAVPTINGTWDWQLEMLCNIAAGEFLMPAQTLDDLQVPSLDIDDLMARQRMLQVSTEALLRRLVFLTEEPATMFCARRRADGGYTIDYSETSRSGGPLLPRGLKVDDTVLQACTAVGYTAKATESWAASQGPLLVQAVGIPPYPGQALPRVAGIVRTAGGNARHEVARPTLKEVTGNALDPKDPGSAIILHITNDRAHAWAGPFGQALARRYPWASQAFRAWTIAREDNLTLGNIHEVLGPLDQPAIISLIAQEGFGSAESSRLRYPALAEALDRAGSAAVRLERSVHAPRIGTGTAQGHWDLVRDQLDRSIVRRGVDVTIYKPAAN